MTRNKGDVLKTSVATSKPEGSFLSNLMNWRHMPFITLRISGLRRNTHAPPTLPARRETSILMVVSSVLGRTWKVRVPFFSPTSSFLLTGRGAAHLVPSVF